MNTKKLGFGLMRLPLVDKNDKGNIDYEMVNKMVDRYMEKGFNYFDTAAPYHLQKSEVAFRECVVKRYPRDTYTITDKLTPFMIKSQEDIPGFFQGQLERCGVDFFDYYLVHTLNESYYKQAKEMKMFEFVAQKKAEGLIKHMGFSFHDKAKLLDQILTEHPEVEYVQLQINYVDWDDDVIESRKCYEVCLKHHKAVLVMEPIKGGLLANVPEETKEILTDASPKMSPASWAIRYAASLDHVVMVLSGMSTMDQLEDNISYMENFEPLSENEYKVIQMASESIQSKIKIDCTSCRYCVDECPKQIAIPEYFKIFNEVGIYGKVHEALARQSYNYYTSNNYGKASECIKCKKCESHCPQHLPISSYLEDVACVFE